MPDRLLVILAKLAHVPIKPAQVRQLMQTPLGMSFLRGFLPKGVRLLGNPGDHKHLAFIVEGRLCLRHLFYEAIALPIAAKHKVLGVVWMVGAAFCLCGLMQTVSNTAGIYACVLVRRGLRNVRGAAPVIHMTRELQVRRPVHIPRTCITLVIGIMMKDHAFCCPFLLPSSDPCACVPSCPHSWRCSAGRTTAT